MHKMQPADQAAALARALGLEGATLWEDERWLCTDRT